MNKQESLETSPSDSENTEEELTSSGMFAFLLFGVPLILILLCEIFDFPGSLFQ